MPNINTKMREIQKNCPAGYTVAAGQAIDMLGSKELWRIFENHTDPDMIRIPEDLVDGEYGDKMAKRVPVEWGRCIYFKVA